MSANLTFLSVDVNDVNTVYDNDVNNGVAIIILIVGKLSINDSEHGFEKLSSLLGFIQVLVAFLRDALPETDMSTRYFHQREALIHQWPLDCKHRRYPNPYK